MASFNVDRRRNRVFIAQMPPAAVAGSNVTTKSSSPLELRPQQEKTGLDILTVVNIKPADADTRSVDTR